jgi:endonuclease/exonuclease/phosphatase family metal-dependent hydrolase
MLRIVSRRLLLWSNICLVTGLLLSAWLPYLNPARFWIAGFSGFFFPILFPIGILFIICWSWFKKRTYLLINIIAVACCIPTALRTWGIHIFHNNNLPEVKDLRQFTLMTYNTSSMGLVRYVTDKDKEAAIYQAIEAGSPAILCMQEFYSNDNPEKEQHIQRIKSAGRYPYHYFTCDKTHWESWYYGIALFSRFPIAAATAVRCGESQFGSGSTFLQADLVVHGDTVRVFSVQLTSYMFRGEDYEHMKAPKGTGLIHKMRRTFERRSAQALQLASLVAESPYPTIVCGDFNDTPVSFTYKTISNNMKDVFLETGAGWGRTLSYLSPSLRIDYILAQPSIDVHGSKVFQIQPSEHFPVMACLSLKKN